MNVAAIMAGAAALWWLARSRSKARNGYQVDIGQAMIDSRHGPTYAAMVSAKPRPLSIMFLLKLSSIEKWGVSADDVRRTVATNGHNMGLPVSGTPIVDVSNVDGGYMVTVVYPDSDGAARAADIRHTIESLDSRLVGRVSDVRVLRA